MPDPTSRRLPGRSGSGGLPARDAGGRFARACTLAPAGSAAVLWRMPTWSGLRRRRPRTSWCVTRAPATEMWCRPPYDPDSVDRARKEHGTAARLRGTAGVHARTMRAMGSLRRRAEGALVPGTETGLAADERERALQVASAGVSGPRSPGLSPVTDRCGTVCALSQLLGKGCAVGSLRTDSTVGSLGLVTGTSALRPCARYTCRGRSCCNCRYRPCTAR